MTYFEGFIAPVPEANKTAYQTHASSFSALSPEFGVGRHVEAWDSDVPEGKVTDFRKAVDAKPDEKVVLAFFEYPSRQARDANGRFRAIQWTYAALNSVEPAIVNLLLIDLFFTGEEWAKMRRPGAEDFVKLKLKRLSDWLGDKTWLEGDRFTIGDLVMTTTLRFLRHTGLVAEVRNLAAYLKRGEARPAFQRALADQLAVYAANQPQPEGAAA